MCSKARKYKPKDGEKSVNRNKPRQGTNDIISKQDNKTIILTVFHIQQRKA